MPTIYLDRDQCEYFGLDYLQPTDDDFICAPDALERSKRGDGYDKETIDYLKSVRGKTLVMQPSGEDGPGWYQVIRLI